VSYAHKRPPAVEREKAVPTAAKTEMVGVDIYTQWSSRNPNTLAEKLNRVKLDGLALLVISNRGLKVWPDGIPETFCTDSFRCRYTAKQSGALVTQRQVISLLEALMSAGLDVVKTETLRNFDGKAGYTLSQGE
jgi:isocitrate dehydrogenase